MALRARSSKVVFVAPDNIDPLKEKSDEGLEPEKTGDSASEKLPPDRQPWNTAAKPAAPVFIEEPDPNFAPSLFADKRYGAYRKQMVLAVVFIVLAAATLSILFWFFPLWEPEEQAAVAPAPPSSQAALGLNPEQARQLQLDTLREQLRAALSNRNWTAIDQLAHAILQKEPADGEAWHALGWVLEKNGDSAEAGEAYAKAASANYLRPQALLKQASMLRLQNKFPEAIKQMEESVRLDPDSVVAPNLLMVCKIQAGQAEAVRAEIKNFEKTGIVANADRYLLGKAALELHDGNFKAAADTLGEFRGQISPPLYAVLAQDRFFDAYRSAPEVQFFLVVP